MNGQSVQEWLAAHPSLPLDLLSAVPYSIHAYVAVAYAIFLYVKDRPRMRYYLIGLTVANYLAFVIWALFPAAPPWYVHAHGCGIDPSVAPNAAGLLRVDAYFDAAVYQGLYSKNSSVFAAMPSMHNGFAMAGLLSAWRFTRWNTRVIHLAYVGVMFFASLYLDHHWIVDALAGWAVAAAGVYLSARMLDALGTAPSRASSPLGAPGAV
jgi:membrane-associated phospholipid phosphatase